jgi:hypothetical protein
MTDPRGIRRKIVAAEWRCDGTRVEFECGHVSTFAAHFAPPKPSEITFCFCCGQEAKIERIA